MATVAESGTGARNRIMRTTLPPAGHRAAAAVAGGLAARELVR